MCFINEQKDVVIRMYVTLHLLVDTVYLSVHNSIILFYSVMK